MDHEIAIPPNGGKWERTGYLPKRSRVRLGKMGSTAILFPGQGSQTEDMRDSVARVRPDLLELAVELVGA